MANKSGFSSLHRAANNWNIENILPPLSPDEYASLKDSIRQFGVQVRIIVDEESNIIDGKYRKQACNELGIDCPHEIHTFESEAQKLQVAISLNCHRRHLKPSQRRELIATYLKTDPRINDTHLGEIIGVSKNTVNGVRKDLERTRQIDKFTKLRGRDGKERPNTYKRISANSPKEAETASKKISNLPANCEGKTFKSSCKITIEESDVLEMLKKLGDNTFDACLSDPPYGLTSIGKRFGKTDSKPPKTDKGSNGVYGRIVKGFMGQTWDSSVPAIEVWQEMLRVCKPGSWMLCFSHPRTYHRLACNIEDAGWEIRDCIIWLYGQGFPKSHDLGKAMGDDTWNGYGTCLKPGYEPIILAMKPFDGSFSNNARKWGVAGLNINGCQIGQEEITINQWKDGCKPFGNGAGHPYESTQSKGRFPANVILDEEVAKLLDQQSPVRKNGKYRKSGQRDPRHKGQQLYGGGIGGGQQNAPDCYGDAGGASRFFYCAKANPNERNAGLEDFPIDRPDKRSGKAMGHFNEKGIQPQQNFHPCVKPIALNKWLSKLILPPERSDPRKLLVPYCGSGSEIIGAMHVGWDEIIGIEREAKYVKIANKRIEWWKKNG